ncbi:MAG: S-layer homology domain-containing protein, partial [bacterium]
MHKYIPKITLISFLGLILLLAGCGPKQRAAEGLLDSPATHYNQGMRKFEAGDLTTAEKEFQEALLLDKKYAPAHAGLSLVYAEMASDIKDAKSKVRKEYLNEADNHLDKARDIDDDNVNVWISYIRYHAILQEDKNWIADCEKGFEKALKIDPQSEAAYYFMGLAYKDALNFRRSEDMLRNSIELDGLWSEKAGLAMHLVHKIVQARPGTKYGKLIALQDEINRADLATLFIEELNVVERIKRREASSTAPDLTFRSENPLEFNTEGGSAQNDILDIKGHWAESTIEDFVATGIFEVSQDHKFYPDEPVTRIEFAGAVQRLFYMITRDETI